MVIQDPGLLHEIGPHMPSPLKVSKRPYPCFFLNHCNARLRLVAARTFLLATKLQLLAATRAEGKVGRRFRCDLYTLQSSFLNVTSACLERLCGLWNVNNLLQ